MTSPVDGLWTGETSAVAGVVHSLSMRIGHASVFIVSLSGVGRDALHLAARDPLLILFPAHRLATGIHRDHLDAFVDGTDQRAEIAAHAIVLPHLGNRFSRDPAGMSFDCTPMAFSSPTKISMSFSKTGQESLKRLN